MKKKMLLATALALLITGCAQQTFTVQNKPAAVAPKETITHHFFVSGIGQKTDAAKIWAKKTVELGSQKLSMQPKFVAAQKTQLKTFVKNIRKWINFYYIFFITLGIYAPLLELIFAHRYAHNTL